MTKLHSDTSKVNRTLFLSARISFTHEWKEASALFAAQNEGGTFESEAAAATGNGRKRLGFTVGLECHACAALVWSLNYRKARRSVPVFWTRSAGQE